MSSLQGLLPGAHIEPRRGSQQQAIEYCKKEGDWQDSGVAKRQGQRKDLEELREILDRGGSISDCYDARFSTTILHRRGLRDYISVKRRKLAPVRRDVTVRVFWGRTGTGKTHKAYEEFPNLWRYPGGKWFDGYDGEPVVLFDDFDWEDIPVKYLLQLTDVYRMQVPVKGGFVPWIPVTIIFTSNFNPELWYPDITVETRAALMRRFTQIKHFD